MSVILAPDDGLSLDGAQPCPPLTPLLPLSQQAFDLLPRGALNLMP